MRPFKNLRAVSLTLGLCVVSLSSVSGSPPEWLINLRPYKTEPIYGNPVVRFTGQFVVVYPGIPSPPLVFDKETHQLVPQERLAGIVLPPREQLAATPWIGPSGERI